MALQDTYVLGGHLRAVTWGLKETHLSFHFSPKEQQNQEPKRGTKKRNEGSLIFIQILRFLSSVNSSINSLPLLISNLTGHCIWNLPPCCPAIGDSDTIADNHYPHALSSHSHQISIREQNPVAFFQPPVCAK